MGFLSRNPVFVTGLALWVVVFAAATVAISAGIAPSAMGIVRTVLCIVILIVAVIGDDVRERMSGQRR